MKQCLLAEVPRVLLLQALASFQTVTRQDPSGRHQHFDEHKQQLYCSKWRETFATFCHFRQLFDKPVQMKHLKETETFLKHKGRFGSSKGNGKRPAAVDSTNGSALFHVQWPPTKTEKAHVFILEKMTTSRRLLRVTAKGKEKVLSVQAITLPIEISQTDFTDPFLLNIPTLLVLATKHSIVLASLARGIPAQIQCRLTLPQYDNFPYLATGSRFGIWG